MSESNRILERTSEFFAVHFKGFEEDLSESRVDWRNPPFVELSLKCCGYGYFSDYKERMLRNFISYLTEAIRCCQALSALKIVFNGFDVDDKEIEKVCEPVFSLIERSSLKTLWLRTSNLRRCRIKDIQELFNIIDKFGICATSEDLSVQMADWEFQEEYPSYHQLFKVFIDFDANIPDSMGLNFRKFRLEISSWYMKEKQAYGFLKDSLDLNAIKGHFLSSQLDEKKGNAHNRQSSASRMMGEERESAERRLDQYLDRIDQVYLFPELPKKKGNEAQYQKMKKQQSEIRATMASCEAAVSAKLIKFPMEYITQLRVDQFHDKMITVIVGLLYRMPNIEDFQIDMRNWHPIFGLSSLKKKLDTQVSTRQQFSIIRRGIGIMSKQFARKKQEKEKEGSEEKPQKDTTLKTTYMM